MTYTDKQIAEALARDAYLCKLAEAYDSPVGHGDALHIVVLASALRAAQERIKGLEAKTVPMEMLMDIASENDELMIDPAVHDAGPFRDAFREIAQRYGYTVIESDKEEGL